MTSDQPDNNPFLIRRWEFETEHVVWVPTKARDVLGQTPCHIQGVRGSGKTAILRIADYYTRRSDRLRLFNKENVIDRCLGIYVSFIEEFTNFMDTEDHPHLYYDYTLLYCLSKTFDLLDDASRDAVLNYDKSSEEFVVQSLVNKYDIKHSRYEKLDSFSSIASYLRRHCRNLRNDALAIGLNTLRVESAIDGPMFFDDFCDLLRDNQILDANGTHFFIKICVDDAHLSSVSAQRKLNNILYRSRAPIFWNIAYVEGQFDPYDIDNRVKYVTGHDREFVDLNYRDDPTTFQEICERVFEIRVKKYFSNQKKLKPSDSFSNLRKYIGKIPIEDMFNRLISRSRKTSVLKEIARYEEILSDVTAVPSLAKKYQAFLAICMFRNPREFRYFCKERTPDQIDNYFRQKGASAIVIGARKLELSVSYEGLNTLLFLSDGCLRDFLSLCSSVYELDNSKSEKRRAFFKGVRLSTDTQSKAFKEYSGTFVRGLHNPRQPYARQLSVLIEGIGRLTFMLQTEEPRLASTQPDLGIFRIDFDPEQRGLLLDEDVITRNSVREILKEAIYTGSIRLEQGNIAQSEALEFRLAGVMCPNFQISPRKPKRRIVLSYLDFADLIERSGTLEARDWAKTRYQRWADSQRSNDYDEPDYGRLL